MFRLGSNKLKFGRLHPPPKSLEDDNSKDRVIFFQDHSASLSSLCVLSGTKWLLPPPRRPRRPSANDEEATSTQTPAAFYSKLSWVQNALCGRLAPSSMSSSLFAFPDRLTGRPVSLALVADGKLSCCSHPRSFARKSSARSSS
jgi:hypothetical protein